MANIPAGMSRVRKVGNTPCTGPCHKPSPSSSRFSGHTGEDTAAALPSALGVTGYHGDQALGSHHQQTGHTWEGIVSNQQFSEGRTIITSF